MLAQAVRVLTMFDFKYDEGFETTSLFSLLGLMLSIIALLSGFGMTILDTQ